MNTPDTAMRDRIISLFEHRMGELSARYSAGELSLGEWQAEMRAELRDAWALQVRAGAGDAGATMDDYLKLGPELRSQYGYLEDFARAIEDGSLSPDAISSRAALYARSSGAMYWKQAMPDMPTYPGEQQCMGNCGCEWLDNGDGSYTWKRSKTDSCDDCIANEQMYQNYVPEGT